MDSYTSCIKVLQSGTRCKNKAKYGDFCGVHREKGPPLLLKLPDDIIYNILRHISHPIDLGNFAKASLHVQFLTSCHIQNMIKYELPLINPSYFNKDERFLLRRYDGIELYRQACVLERKWVYLLFLAIGGLYTNFKKTENALRINNKSIHVHISNKWNNRRTINNYYLENKKDTRCFSSVFSISISYTISHGSTTNIDSIEKCHYRRTFETTNFAKIEQYFWKHCMS